MRFALIILFLAVGALRLMAQSPQLAPAPNLPEADRMFGAVPNKGASKSISINTTSKAAVVAAYKNVYQPALAVASGWTGAISGCNAGTTSAGYAQATFDMVNYYRAMAGLPGNITQDNSVTAKCQQAALMMLAEGSLSHTPPTTWACYTAGGAEAAGKSNIALGSAGAASVSLYMNDFGSNNTAVGHRRWVLYPPQVTMGTGSVTGQNGLYSGANDLWVIGTFGSRPASPEYVAWPPPGYVPYTLVYARWSFSYSNADFSNATISMTRNGANVKLTKLAIANGYGDNTVVWEPAGMPLSKPASDVVYQVTINNVKVGANTRNFQYTTTAIDPDAPLPQNAVRQWTCWE